MLTGNLDHSVQAVVLKNDDEEVDIRTKWMKVVASSDSSDFVLLDLPMTLLTRDGKQLDLFIKLTTHFIFLDNTLQRNGDQDIQWYKDNLASMCKELEMLLHLRKRLELIDDQAPDSTEWAEYFDGYIKGKWEDVLDPDKESVKDLYTILQRDLCNRVLIFFNKVIVKQLSHILFQDVNINNLDVEKVVKNMFEKDMDSLLEITVAKDELNNDVLSNSCFLEFLNIIKKFAKKEKDGTKKTCINGDVKQLTVEKVINIQLGFRLLKAINEIFVSTICCRYDFILKTVCGLVQDVFKKSIKGENSFIYRVLNDTSDDGLISLLTDSIYKNAYGLTDTDNGNLLEDVLKKAFEIFLGGNKDVENFASEILRCTNYVISLGSIHDNIDIEANVKSLRKFDFRGSVDDFGNILGDPSVKVCVEALLALLERDNVTGKLSPNLDKIRPLAEQLGGFHDENLKSLLSVVDKLSSVYGGNATSLGDTFDGIDGTSLTKSLTREFSQQLAAQNSKLLKDNPAKSMVEVLTSSNFSYEEFVRLVYKFVDMDGNGSITFDEFFELLRQMRLDISAEAAALLFAKFDTEGNGIITEAEFDLGFHHITDIMVDMALIELGITWANIIQILLVGSIFLMFLVVFILLGVEAFTTGTNFAAVVNSLADSCIYRII